MCKVDFGQADTIVMLDVLHYVSFAAQNDVLQRVRTALLPEGILILRVGDADAGLPFWYSVWVDHVVTFVRGHHNARLYCRSLSAWRAALVDLGFTLGTLAMIKGTPFANVLLVARLGKPPFKPAPGRLL